MKKKKWLFATLFAIAGITACTKFITTDIGVGELIPPVDGVNVKDTILDVVINTYGTTDASLRIDEVHTLGMYADAEFGRTKGNVYVQVQPSSFPYRFAVSKDSITAIDSVVLVMQTYGRSFGDTAQNAGFRIYEVNDVSFSAAGGYPFNTSKTFIANNELSYNNAEQLIRPTHLKDSVKAFGETTASINQLRFRLNPSFGQRLINLDTAYYRTDSLFRLAFNGFKVAATSGNVLLPVLPAGSKLAVYYKYTSQKDGTVDTAVNYFISNVSTLVSANNIVNTYSGTPVASLPAGDTAVGAPFVYLQTGPGLYAQAKIPGLNNLPNMLIYRAELLLDEAPRPAGFDSSFIPALYVSGVENGKNVLLRDVQLAEKSMGNVGLNSFYTTNLQEFGSYAMMKRDTLNGLYYHQYNFKLTSHVQDVVKKITPNYALNIFAPFSDSAYSRPLNRYVHIQEATGSGSYYNLNYPAIHRTKIYGNSTSFAHKIRLHIVYSPVQ